MTEKQILQALKTELLAQNWTGGSNKVFGTGSVIVTTGRDRWALDTMRVPIALIKPLDSQSDPEFGDEPNLVQFNVGVRLITAVGGDALGENPLLGANLTQGATYSPGKGIFDVEQELFNAIGKLNVAEALIIQCTQKSETETELQGTAMVAFRDYIFETWCTAV
ncbi:MAG TPA: hypothetical protein DEH78_20235 [Solibacterales bacterium]|nr:hypothetical protein [Bryobacterales bacterium]